MSMLKKQIWTALVSRCAVAALAAVLVMTAAGAQAEITSLKFDFGPGKVEPGYIQILPEMVYSQERGYGFEPGAQIAAIERSAGGPLMSDFCTSDGPFCFSVKLPEGNYKATVTLGDSSGGTGKTTAEMQMESTFTDAGWDFVGETANGTEDIWWMPENNYPRLWWERIPEN